MMHAWLSTAMLERSSSTALLLQLPSNDAQGLPSFRSSLLEDAHFLPTCAERVLTRDRPLCTVDHSNESESGAEMDVPVSGS